MPSNSRLSYFLQTPFNYSRNKFFPAGLHATPQDSDSTLLYLQVVCQLFGLCPRNALFSLSLVPEPGSQTLFKVYSSKIYCSLVLSFPIKVDNITLALPIPTQQHIATWSLKHPTQRFSQTLGTYSPYLCCLLNSVSFYLRGIRRDKENKEISIHIVLQVVTPPSSSSRFKI